MSRLVAVLEFVGDCALMLGDAARRVAQRPVEFGETVKQCAFIGVASLPIVILTGFFSGGVLALYLSGFLTRFGATTFVGATVGLSMTREIGPVISGVVVAARCGSSIAAQLGSMSVNEQVDALRMLSVHPTRYLVLPRLWAGLLMMPVLSLVCTTSGLIGAALVANAARVPYGTFWRSVASFGTIHDLLGGMAKSPVFGLMIALTACRMGLGTRGGSEAVGRAVTATVVVAITGVYVLNFLLAAVIFR